MITSRPKHDHREGNRSEREVRKKTVCSLTFYGSRSFVPSRSSSSPTPVQPFANYFILQILTSFPLRLRMERTQKKRELHWGMNDLGWGDAHFRNLSRGNRLRANGRWRWERGARRFDNTRWCRTEGIYVIGGLSLSLTSTPSIRSRSFCSVFSPADAVGSSCCSSHRPSPHRHFGGNSI